MGVLADWQIERDVPIRPARKGPPGPGEISSGLGSYGLDIRCGYRFKVFTPTHVAVVDPKDFDPKAFVDVDLTPDPFNPAVPDYLLLPPHSFCLAESVEWLKIPRDVVAIVQNKSTYARCGILCPATVLEPEWEGIVTLEIANTTPLPAKIYPGEGIAQVIFLRSDGALEAALRAFKTYLDETSRRPGLPGSGIAAKAYDLLRVGMEKQSTCRVSYADKKGRYQSQAGLTLPFVKKGE